MTMWVWPGVYGTGLRAGSSCNEWGSPGGGLSSQPPHDQANDEENDAGDGVLGVEEGELPGDEEGERQVRCGLADRDVCRRIMRGHGDADAAVVEPFCVEFSGVAVVPGFDLFGAGDVPVVEEWWGKCCFVYARVHVAVHRVVRGADTEFQPVAAVGVAAECGGADACRVGGDDGAVNPVAHAISVGLEGAGKQHELCLRYPVRLLGAVPVVERVGTFFLLYLDRFPGYRDLDRVIVTEFAGPRQLLARPAEVARVIVLHDDLDAELRGTVCAGSLKFRDGV